MTLKELAALAGVSVSTVSRVLGKNDVRAASSATREKIWRIARQTGYVPNQAAQLLQRGEVQHAQHQLACILARTGSEETDPFFSQIYHSVQQRCLQKLAVLDRVYTAAEFQQRPPHQHPPGWDGVLVLGRYTKTLLEKLRADCKNVVYIGLNPIRDSYDQVICDGYSAATMAVEYLHSLGHRRIGYIGEMLTEARYRGYYDAMEERKLPLHRGHIINSKQSVAGGRHSAAQLLSSGQPLPTAIFCANDITAVGVMEQLSGAGISVPGDVSVMGIDDIALCQSTAPTLTSITIPKEELGRMGVNVLIDRIEGGHRLPIKVEIPFTLCKRQSCGPAPQIE